MAVNWGGAGLGALSGAGTGAALGSFFPGIGTAIGATLGGLGGGLAGLFSGEEGGLKQLSTITPEQMQILEFLMSQGQQGLQNPYAGFEPIAQQAQNQFSQSIVPSLAERFTSMGSNALSSPAFASQLGQAGAGLSENLAAMRSQYGMQNQQNALRMLQLGLSPSFENYNQQPIPGFGEKLFQNGPSWVNALRTR